MVGQSHYGCLRGDIDNLATPLLKQMAPDGLGKKKHALQIDGHNPIPLGFGRLLGRRGAAHAGIVDQNVNGPKMRQDLINNRLHTSRIRYVQGKGPRAILTERACHSRKQDSFWTERKIGSSDQRVP